MAMLWEHVLVVAKDFLAKKNINNSSEYNQPIYKSKLELYGWDFKYVANAAFVEVVWKMTVGLLNNRRWRELDQMFSISPIAIHANFRGSKYYKTGNIPEKGAIVIWRRGNSWQGSMGIVSEVSEDKKSFDQIEGRAMEGMQEGRFIDVQERKGKRVDLPFKVDKLNLVGFIYPPDTEMAYGNDYSEESLSEQLGVTLERNVVEAD